MIAKLRRGTTEPISYDLPFPADRLAAAYITVQQNDETVIEKKLEDMAIDGNRISVKLTQTETLALESGVFAMVQLRARDVNGDSYDSEVELVTVGMLLKDGEI